MPKSSAASADKWYPTRTQLEGTPALERAFRQLLTQHYELRDKFNAMEAKQKETQNPKHPPGSGPTDTQLCGLYVQPVNPQTMANGATLKWNKSTGNFSFQ
jgi:hypothetical protein